MKIKNIILYLTIFTGFIFKHSLLYSQISEEEARKEIIEITSITSIEVSERKNELLQKMKNNPSPYVNVIQKDLVLPQDRASLSVKDTLNHYRALIWFLFYLGTPQAKGMILDEYYKQKAIYNELERQWEESDKTDPYYSEISDAYDNLISLQVDVIRMFKEYNDDRIVDDCIDRMVDGSNTIESIIKEYFRKVAIGNQKVIDKMIELYEDESSLEYDTRNMRATINWLNGEVPALRPRADYLRFFSLMATHSLWLKQNVQILSGHVGVERAGEGPFLDSGVELSVGNNAELAWAVSIKANRIKIKQNAEIGGHAFYNELDNNGTISGRLYTPLEFPVLKYVPEFLNANSGLEDIVVKNKKEYVMEPGQYRDIRVEQKGRLIFTGGTYHIQNLTAGNNTRILFSGKSEVRLAGRLETGNQAVLGPEDTTAVRASDILFYIAGMNGETGQLDASPKACEMGIKNTVYANFYVPDGTFRLGENSILRGAVLARDVEIDNNTEVSLESAFVNLQWSEQQRRD